MDSKKSEAKKRETQNSHHDRGSRGEDNSATSSGGHKKTRRGKDEEIKRNFACGCGKTYLSYPALYTHVKQKHDGKCPDGSTVPQTHPGRSGRGRPPKVVRSDAAAEKKSDPAANPIHNFMKFLSELETKYERDLEFINLSKSTGKSLKIVQDENSSDMYDPMAQFPTGWFSREEDYKPVYDALENLLKSPMNGKVHEGDSAKDNLGVKTESNHMESMGRREPVSTNKTIAMYIKDIKDYVGKDFYAELVFFLLLYRRALNEEGFNMLKSLKLIPENDHRYTSAEFCEMYSPEYTPDMSNEFVLHLLPKYLQEFHDRPLMWLGVDEERIKNAVFFTQFFCSWLYENKYTSAPITIDVDGGEVMSGN